jgi:hypothetical protein
VTEGEGGVGRDEGLVPVSRGPQEAPALVPRATNPDVKPQELDGEESAFGYDRKKQRSMAGPIQKPGSCRHSLMKGSVSDDALASKRLRFGFWLKKKVMTADCWV